MSKKCGDFHTVNVNFFKSFNPEAETTAMCVFLKGSTASFTSSLKTISLWAPWISLGIFLSARSVVPASHIAETIQISHGHALTLTLPHYCALE